MNTDINFVAFLDQRYGKDDFVLRVIVTDKAVAIAGKGFANCNPGQRVALVFFGILTWSGIGCFLYSLFMLVVRLFDYIWVTLP